MLYGQFLSISMLSVFIDIIVHIDTSFLFITNTLSYIYRNTLGIIYFVKFASTYLFNGKVLRQRANDKGRDMKPERQRKPRSTLCCCAPQTPTQPGQGQADIHRQEVNLSVPCGWQDPLLHLSRYVPQGLELQQRHSNMECGHSV